MDAHVNIRFPGIGIFNTLFFCRISIPENPEIEAEENRKAELKTTAETISGNLALPEAMEREPGVPVVVIDPGHGGEDEGCEKNGIQEKDINLAIAEMVRDRLEGMGYQAVLAREDDTYTAKEERVKESPLSSLAFAPVLFNVS